VDEPVPGGWQIWLSAQESADMIRSYLDAPAAAPCSVAATQMASVVLRRPDGSGGSSVSVELDGCRRMGNGAAPASLIDRLSR
jgi:hypothetical protein